MTLDKFFRLLLCCVGSALVIGTANNVFGDFYFQGGVSVWPGYDVPRLTTSGVPIERSQETSVVGSADFWIGAGYSVNEEWSFEAYYARLPSTEAFSRFNVFYQGLPVDPPAGTITLYIETTMVGVGGVYEFALSDRISLIGKAGVAYAQKASDLDIVSQFQIPLAPEDVDDFDESDITHDLGNAPFDDDDDRALDMYFAVGLRIPLQLSNASVTATYQFVNTAANTESGLFAGIRWDL